MDGIGQAKGISLALEDLVNELRKLPTEASTIAEEAFPGQQSDFTERNAFRHALGTGLIAQKLRERTGSETLGKLGAKGGGYIWELLGLADQTKGHFPDGYKELTPAQKYLDIKLDLNANAVGADTAMSTPDREALIAALLQKAKESKVTTAPSFFESSPGYLVHSMKE